MIKFICPYCHKSAYSAYLHDREHKIKCIYCGKFFPNEHYKAKNKHCQGKV